MARDLKFIHLRTHSEYSLLEGAIRLKELPRLCVQNEMPAVAVTDKNNLFSALEFSVAALAEGIQPIIGCQIDIKFKPCSAKNRFLPVAPIILLAQNEQGYKNLLKLNSCFYLEKKDIPHITKDDLGKHSEGIICLTGGPDGPLGQLIRSSETDLAKTFLAELSSNFPSRLYIELQRHPEKSGLLEAEKATEYTFVKMAYEFELPLVATNDAYFQEPSMYEAHDALLCIAERAFVDQQEPRRKLSPQYYFKTQDEMAALFSDLPEALENTIEISKRCAFCAETRDPILPKFADNEVDELRHQARTGLKERLSIITLSASKAEYENRLEFELSIIEKMGFPGYFLIVADIIKWAKSNSIPVGPGRGSGAGSLVAYALTITDLDPIRYSLLFERFLNPDRISMPDFDIDFCMSRREEVINYVQEKYGRDRVGQIITFGAMLSKMVVRDVGRVLQMPYGQVDNLAKMIPVEGVKPVSIEKALADEQRLRQAAKSEEVVARLLNYGQKLEGLLRNAATHAAGVVIGDRPLDEVVPLYRDPGSDMPATQFNMKWVEQAGLVKFDFLGLKTLTVIKNAVELILMSGRNLHISEKGNKLFEPPISAINDINAIPLDDKKTFELYASAKTVGVFQVESSGMMDALKRMKPNCIEDIVALVALYRPGPMDSIPTYCDVKNGLRERVSIHPLIDHVLEETQGIIVYQEQVMQIAQIMANYSLGGADLLRRAMGKKIKAAMDAERPKFEKGAKENGIDAKKASEIFDLLEKFANYGFNKSHAAAYAVVSYQTAWLKANHPVELIAGAMNCDIHLTEKLSIYFEELKQNLSLKYLPPCINRSSTTFSVSNGVLVYALGAIKNVGVEAMKLITDARNTNEKQCGFSTLFDFSRRVDLKKIGKRPLEMLARSGAFDQLDSNRQSVFQSIDALINYSAAVHEQRASNQVSLFGDGGDDLPEPRISKVADWLPAERLAEEFQAIGFYISGHPLDDYTGELQKQSVLTIEELGLKAEKEPCLAKISGIVAGCQERISTKGNRFAYVQLSDTSGAYEITLFSDVLEKYRHLIKTGEKLVISVEASTESEQLKLLARSLILIDEIITKNEKTGLKIFLKNDAALTAISSVLEQSKAIAKNSPFGPIHFCLLNEELPGEITINLGEQFPVGPQVKGAIKSLEGVIEVEEL